MKRSRHVLAVGVVAALMGCSGEIATLPTEPGATTSTPGETEDRVAEAAPDDVAPGDLADDAASIVVMWARGGLSRDVAEAARALEGVVSVGFRRRETVGLITTVDAQGDVVEDWADGWRVPLQAIAVDPGSGAERETPLSTVRAGTVLLSSTAAASLEVGVGDQVVLVDLRPLIVAGVVDDALIGSSELVVSSTDADLMGWDGQGSLVVEHTRADARSLETDLLSLVPGATPARVVIPDDDGPRAASLVLPLSEVKRQFGTFAYRPREDVREIDIDPEWVTENIVSADMPLLGTVRCHREIVDDLAAVLGELVDRGLGDLIRSEEYAGCYHARRTGTGADAGLSRHSWGIAIDINVDLGAPGGGIPLPDQVIDVFEQRGFRWGGDFLIADNHHFEWVGIPA